MSDDPREILAEAGVECAELEEYLYSELYWPDDARQMDSKHHAILALARLVAKYKKVANHVQWYPDDAYKLCYNGDKALPVIMELCDCVDRSKLTEDEDRDGMKTTCPAYEAMPPDWD